MGSSNNDGDYVMSSSTNSNSSPVRKEEQRQQRGQDQLTTSSHSNSSSGRRQRRAGIPRELKIEKKDKGHRQHREQEQQQQQQQQQQRQLQDCEHEPWRSPIVKGSAATQEHKAEQKQKHKKQHHKHQHQAQSSSSSQTPASRSQPKRSALKNSDQRQQTKHRRQRLQQQQQSQTVHEQEEMKLWRSPVLKPEQRGRRRVRFATERVTSDNNDIDENQVIETNVLRVFHEPEIKLTEEDMKKVWWSRDDTSFHYKEAKKVVIDYKKNHPNQRKLFFEFFQNMMKEGGLNTSFSSSLPSLAASSVSDSSSPPSSGRSIDSSSSTSPPTSTSSIGGHSVTSSVASMKHIMQHYDGLVTEEGLLSAWSCRGLERQIHTILAKHRPEYIQNVLDIQNKLKGADLDADTKARVTSAKASKLSRPSRMLARLLAHSDHLVLAKSIREELRGSSMNPNSKSLPRIN